MSELLKHNTIMMKTGEKNCLIMTVVPASIMGLPKKGDIFHVGAIMQKNIMSSNQPQTLFDVSGAEERKDLIGMGAAGIIRSDVWAFRKMADPFGGLYG